MMENIYSRMKVGHISNFKMKKLEFLSTNPTNSLKNNEKNRIPIPYGQVVQVVLSNFLVYHYMKIDKPSWTYSIKNSL